MSWKQRKSVVTSKGMAMAAAFTYRGNLVRISHTSDIPYEMRANGRYADLVQKVIDQTTPWVAGEDPIEQLRLPGSGILPMAVRVCADTKIRWGVHRGHKARVPGLSPFVHLTDVDEKLMDWLTIELVGPPENPLLARAYGGTYTPPLPWMGSAKRDADGGYEACLKYWQSHAYLQRGLGLIKSGTGTPVAPYWFDQHA